MQVGGQVSELFSMGKTNTQRNSVLCHDPFPILVSGDLLKTGWLICLIVENGKCLFGLSVCVRHLNHNHQQYHQHHHHAIRIGQTKKGGISQVPLCVRVCSLLHHLQLGKSLFFYSLFSSLHCRAKERTIITQHFKTRVKLKRKRPQIASSLVVGLQFQLAPKKRNL